MYKNERMKLKIVGIDCRRVFRRVCEIAKKRLLVSLYLSVRKEQFGFH
jgi:hypothetical protein